MKNSVTFMPARLAVKKWPASCSMMISGRVSTTPTIETWVRKTIPSARISSAAGPSRLVREHKAAERRTVGVLEGERAQRRPVDRAEGFGKPIRSSEGQADRKSHVGRRELRHCGAVDELDHAVHDRLRMDDD